MKSVAGADRDPRAGSPRGVVDATGYCSRPNHPVATAPGTDFSLLRTLNLKPET